MQTTMPALPDSAEGWLARLRSPECTAEEHAAFEDWLAVKPDNAIAYAEAEILHAAVHTAMRMPDAHQPAAVSADGKRAEVLQFRPRQPEPRNRILPLLTLAASLTLVAGLAFWLRPDAPPPAPQAYATAVGEQRTVTLPDGSSLVLDTDSRVSVDWSADTRRIVLDHGRLQADVEHDPARPFIVEAGSGSVRALGTVFQVARDGEGTVVSLIEGRVRVDTRHAGTTDSVELASLHEVRYDDAGRMSTLARLDHDIATAWVHGRLVFKDQPLADLVEQMNRYSSERLLIADEATADIRISGVFDAHDTGALVDALQRGWNIHVARTAEREMSLSAAKP